MGLFSKWFARKREVSALFAERDLEFNRERLQKAMIKQSELLYEYRSDASHQAFADYVRYLLNLEILQLAEGKLESYEYRRGRVDALRNVLNARETFIQNKENLRKSPTKGPGEQEAKRSYVRAPSSQAGLQI